LCQWAAWNRIRPGLLADAGRSTASQDADTRKKVTKHGIEGGADGELFDDRSAQHQLVRIV
jgi:hypothetical protein